jgi:hypothetical protein
MQKLVSHVRCTDNPCEPSDSRTQGGNTNDNPCSTRPSLWLWQEIERHFRCLANFFGKRDMRNRFVATCVQTLRPDASHLFKSWSSGGTFVWKWEYLERFLRDLLDVFDVFVECFSADRLSSGALIDNQKEKDSEINATIVRGVASALRFPHMKGHILLLYTVAVRLGMEARWCEGCFCHEHILQDERKSMVSRRRNYRAESQQCSNRGRRAVEMVAGRVSRICSGIRDAHSNRYLSYLMANPAGRYMLASEEASIKDKICDTIVQKLGFWFHLPHSLLGCIVNEYGGTIEEAKLRCRSCLAERDSVLAAGNLAKLHRVARRFLVDDGDLKRELESFANSADNLGPNARFFGRAFAEFVVPRGINVAHS